MTFVVYVGPMFAGKTLEIVQRAREAIAQGRRAVILRSKRDTRDGDANDPIITHDGAVHVDVPVVACDSIASAAITFLTNDVICIDELHFFASGSNVAGALEMIRDAEAQGKHIYCAGLDYDWRRVHMEYYEPFARHAEIVRLCGICSQCGGSSEFSSRRADVSDDAFASPVGGHDKYVALCAKCWSSGTL